MSGSIYRALYRMLTNRLVLATVVALPLMAAAFAVPMGNDEGLWNYMGRAWARDGVAPYSGAFDNKPPGIYILYALCNLAVGVNTWLVRTVGAAVVVLTGLLLYTLGRRLCDRTAGALAMAVFGLTMPTDIMDGWCTSMPETYMLLFTVLAFFLLDRGRTTITRGRYLACIFLSGLAMGIAFFFWKQIALTSAVGLVIYYLSRRRYTKVDTNVARDLLIGVTGGVVSAVGLAVLLYTQDIPFVTWWQATVLSLFRVGAVTPWLGGRVLRFFLSWQQSELFIFCPLLLLFLAQRRSIVQLGIPYAAIIAWVIADFLGSNATGNYYGHQLRQAIPALALASGIGLSVMLRTWPADALKPSRRAATLLAAAIIFLMPYGVLSNYAIRRPMSDPKRELGLWIKANSTQEDYVYTCSRGGEVLSRSERRCPSQFFFLTFLELPRAKAQLLRDLAARPPKFITVQTGRFQIAPDCLKEFIEESYTLRAAKWGHEIFERKQNTCLLLQSSF